MIPTQIKVEEIKPDPNQPRKIFTQKHIEGLAESIKTEGIINPIEVDANNQIITGECRWRAAKLAGLTTVPVQLNDGKMSKYERLRRQIAENVHQSGATDEAMNPIDTATGYKNLLEMMGWEDSKAALQSFKDGYGQDYVKKLSEEIGVTRQSIYDYLKLLDQPDFVIEKVRQGDSFTNYLEADRAPEEHQEALKQKIAEGGLGKNQIREEISRIKKLPELAEINIEDTDDSIKRIISAVTKLGLALQETPLDRLMPQEQRQVANNLSWLMAKIMEYVGKNKSEDIKVIN
jgi:ParB family transcriptional regulator, chromosome partitioning protein